MAAISDITLSGFSKEVEKKNCLLPYPKSYLWTTQESKLHNTDKLRCYMDGQPLLVIIK
jgi:hypothetical protein